MSPRYAYYPGCSGLGTSMEYESSTRAVLSALSLDLIEIPDWSCCGSTPAHTVDHVLSCALAARNLALAEEAGAETVITPCPSCLTNLKVATHRMAEPAFKAKVNKLLDRPFSGRVQVKSVLQALYEDIGPEELAKRVVKPLTGLSIAPYYGCIMNRPPEVMEFDDHENPVAMDRLLAAVGVDVRPYPLKVECCGASYGIARNDVVMRLSGKLLEMAVDVGAAAMATACPLCQMNLDLRQGQVNAATHSHYELPIFYYTQLIGLALGLPAREVGLGKLCVDPRPLLSSLEAAQKQAANA
jgi:heterodisulfide reductase subunit B